MNIFKKLFSPVVQEVPLVVYFFDVMFHDHTLARVAATFMELDEGVIFMYNGDTLEAVFNLAAVKSIIRVTEEVTK